MLSQHGQHGGLDNVKNHDNEDDDDRNGKAKQMATNTAITPTYTIKITV